MKIQAINVARAFGISEKSGNPYEMFTIERLIPTEDVTSKTINKDTGQITKEYNLLVGNKGFRVDSIGVRSDIYDALKRDFDSLAAPGVFCHELDVDIDIVNRRTIVVGYRLPVRNALVDLPSSSSADSAAGFFDRKKAVA